MKVIEFTEKSQWDAYVEWMTDHLEDGYALNLNENPDHQACMIHKTIVMGDGSYKWCDHFNPLDPEECPEQSKEHFPYENGRAVSTCLNDLCSYNGLKTKPCTTCFS